MRSLALACCVAAFATASLAQDVEVRSGRHDDFIRLIVDLPRRMDLKIEQREDIATVIFPDQQLTFDTDPVFRRIARDRILDVTAGPGKSSLEIRLGCRCEVSSFWHDSSLLVLDVRERSDEVLAADTATEVELSEQENDRPIDKPRLKLPRNGSSFAASLANSQLQSASPVETPPIKPVDKPAEDKASPNTEIVSEARERLVQQIGRAASQGLLSPRSALKPTIMTKPEAKETTSDGLSVEAPEEPSATQPKSIANLRAQSSIDRDFLDVMNRRIGSMQISSCPGDNRIDVGSWGTDAPFAQQVGSLRVVLTGEFDLLNQDAALRLVKLYLYYGFGAEAEMALAQIEQPSDDLALLQSLAEVMEDGYASTNSALTAHLSCDGNISLWAILAYQSLPTDVPIEIDNALRTFDALPRHLRRHLGPTLSRRFLDAGYQEASDKTLRILKRHEETLTADAELLIAESDLAEGEAKQAVNRMNEVVASNSEHSVDALIGLIDAALEAGQTVSFDHAVLAGAYAQEHRGSPLENKLIRAYLAGLSASGAFDQSYEEYSRLATDLPPEALTDIQSQMLHQLTQRADDVTFLRFALLKHSEHQQKLPGPITNATASRLLDLGFPEAARPFLETDTLGDAGRARRILRSSAALAEGRPRQAELDLAGVEGRDADQLRAQARSALGDHHAATALYSSMGEHDRSLRQAWFAEDWGRLVESEDTAMADIAALVSLSENEPDTTPEIPANPKSERVLAHNRELIQQSLAARDTIDAILQRSPSPDTERP